MYASYKCSVQVGMIQGNKTEYSQIEPEYRNITSATLSHYVTKKHFASQIERILDASEVAQKKIDYHTAHNREILHAIEVVEEFLRKTKRICYGGQAINAHLPASHKIYDPTYSIPDYDFFTPSSANDIHMLTNLLKRAGFTEISIREGMHEGTTKVYVDYIPVADITSIHSKIYEILYKRSATFDGIHYLDASSLRMLMYLELSRPRGEVGRWSKVFERLMIFNEFIPITQCRIRYKSSMLSSEQITMLMRFITDRKRIFAGADLIDVYGHMLTHKRTTVHLDIAAKKPILFFSPNSYQDALYIVSQFHSLSNKKYKIQTLTIQKSDIIPFFTIIKQGKHIVTCIIEYSACHAYVELPFDKGDTIRIASLDTLITLYFSLGLLDRRLFTVGSMECMANKLVEINMKIRQTDTMSILPFISVTCEGHQKMLPSLIREKLERITRKRNNEKRKTYRNRR
jgi:hypothetical protein